MQLKTSTKISIKFTLFTASILLILGVFLNLFFFSSRYGSQQHKVNNQWMMERARPQRMPPLWPRDIPQEIVLEDQLAKNIIKQKQIVNIAHIDDERILFTQKNGKLSFVPIENQMEMQIMLLKVSLRLFFIFSILSYIVSLFFVKSSLKSLKQLVDFVQWLDPETLHKKISLPGPANDEVKIVAETINTFLVKIHHHTQALKDFVSNASHEIKTPLMSISTSIDYMLKAKTYESGLVSIKWSIKHINELLEQLLLIAKLDAYDTIATEKTNISKLLITTIEQIKDIYSGKKLLFVLHIKKNITLPAHPAGVISIIKNLLDNACKYTKSGGTITITLNENMLEIKDTGIGMDQKALSHIRERFWRADESRSEWSWFGLWLYLVHKFVHVHGRKIVAESQLKKGSTFTINFA